MRVIGGEFRSRKLFEVDSDKTRETRDRVKESIFNSINTQLYGAKVLDLFAGSGSLGIEAISRGSSSSVFIDVNNRAVRTIKANLDNLNINERSSVYQSDYLSYLNNCSDVFDVILLDPPYELKVINECVKIIADKRLLAKNGIIVTLYGKDNSINLEKFDIISYKEKKMGITNITYLKWGT